MIDVTLDMIVALDARNALHAYGQFFLGAFLVFNGIWTLRRAVEQRPFFVRRRRWLPKVPGRVPFGLFLVLTAWPVMEFGINRFRHLTNDQRILVNNDWDTILPIYAALLCAVWTTVRMVKNDLGDRDE